MNLYGFVGNGGGNVLDYLGLDKIVWFENSVSISAKYYSYEIDDRTGIRYRVEGEVNTVTAEELNNIARVIFGESVPTNTTAPSTEQIAMAVVVRNRIGSYSLGTLLKSAHEVISQRGQFLAYDGQRYRTALDPAYRSLNRADCIHLISSINAVEKVFLDKEYAETTHNSFMQKSPSNVRSYLIGKHYFWTDNSISNRQVDGVMNYLTKEDVDGMDLKKFTIAAGMNLQREFRNAFGYSHGYADVLKKWNPDFNFNSYQAGAEIIFLQ